MIFKTSLLLLLFVPSQFLFSQSKEKISVPFDDIFGGGSAKQHKVDSIKNLRVPPRLVGRWGYTQLFCVDEYGKRSRAEDTSTQVIVLLKDHTFDLHNGQKLLWALSSRKDSLMLFSIEPNGQFAENYFSFKLISRKRKKMKLGISDAYTTVNGIQQKCPHAIIVYRKLRDTRVNF